MNSVARQLIIIWEKKKRKKKKVLIDQHIFRSFSLLEILSTHTKHIDSRRQWHLVSDVGWNIFCNKLPKTLALILPFSFTLSVIHCSMWKDKDMDSPLFQLFLKLKFPNYLTSSIPEPLCFLFYIHFLMFWVFCFFFSMREEKGEGSSDLQRVFQKKTTIKFL